MAEALGRGHALPRVPGRDPSRDLQNAVEALNRQLRKVLKIRGRMPSEQAALKLLYMAIRNAQKNWGGRDKRWNTALLQFAIYFEGRIHD